MNIVVISLERAKERREYIQSQLKSLNIEAIIMDAIDVQKLSEFEKSKKIHLQGGYRFGDTFKPGEIACTMSHIQTIKIAKENNWPHFIVLEDDVVLAEDFEKRIKILFNILPNNWEHVYLSGIPRLGLSTLPNLQFLNVVPTIFTECTHSMLIRDIAYNKIISYLSKFETTTDDSYNNMISKETLKSYTYYPFVTYAYDPFTYIWEHKLERVHPSKKYFKNRI
jgi:glycosyl transferase family 25